MKFVGFNRPVTLGEQMGRDLEKKGLPPDQIRAAIEQAMADPIQAQALTQQVGTENVPSQMWMDITIEEVPDVANLAAEQFDGLIKLAQAGVVLPPKAYIKASNLRNKSEILEELDAQTNDPAAQEQAQKAAQIQEATALKELEKLDAEIAKLRTDAETAKRQAATDVESAQADAQAAQIKLQAEVIKAQALLKKAELEREELVLKIQAEREKHAAEMARIDAHMRSEAETARIKREQAAQQPATKTKRVIRDENNRITGISEE
jgi:hypothetical protein